MCESRIWSTENRPSMRKVISYVRESRLEINLQPLSAVIVQCLIDDNDSSRSWCRIDVSNISKRFHLIANSYITHINVWHFIFLTTKNCLVSVISILYTQCMEESNDVDVLLVFFPFSFIRICRILIL